MPANPINEICIAAVDLPELTRGPAREFSGQHGVSLIELIAFIVIVGIASGALFQAYNYSLVHNVDPLIELRALELAQSKLDDVLALKYDENTPTGGIPACGSTVLNGAAPACTNSTDANMNDVDDYNGVSDTPYAGYTRTVAVTTAADRKLVTVTIVGPKNWTIKLAAIRANF